MAMGYGNAIARANKDDVMPYKVPALVILLLPMLTACSVGQLKPPSITEAYEICIHGEAELPKTGDGAETDDGAKNGGIRCNPRPANENVVSTVKASAEAARTFGIQQAVHADEAAGFRLGTDSVAFGAASAAAVGVVANAHSDLYKAAASMAGVALGLKTYGNPDLQSSIYLKASSASRCIYRNLSELAWLLPPELSHEELKGSLANIELNRILLKSTLYSGESSAYANLSPAQTYIMYNQASNADIHAQAKKDAVNFLLSIDLITEDSLIAIREKQILALSEGAFIIADAIEKIPQVSASSDEGVTKDTEKLKPESDIPYTRILEAKAALTACVNKVQP